MAEIKYVIRLAPVTKKNSQRIMINKATGRPFIMPSQKYRQYEKDAVQFLRPLPPRPIACELNIQCLFYLPTRRRTDLTNLLEAVDDLLVHAGIIADDHYGIVAAHDGSRCFLDKGNPRTEVYITKMPADRRCEPMRPVQTDTTNIILVCEGCRGLPATALQYGDGRQEFETCWELTPEELATVQRTGKIYLNVIGRAHPPVALTVESVLE